VRAVIGDKPIDPEAVRKYLASKFGPDLDATHTALAALAQSLEPETLAREAYSLYEKFRPKIASGKRGWGQKGELDLGLIRSLAEGNR
jgi:hypothetical protein